MSGLTNYIVGSLDLSGIFQPYTSGINAVTGYKISSGQDLSGIFQPYISGNQALPTNYFVFNYNGLGITKDLSDIFAPYNPNIITPSGGTPTTSGLYTIVSFLGSSGTINVNSTVSNTFYYLVVGGGGPGGGDQGGGGGAGGVLQGSFLISGSDTINIIVGAGGIITFNTSTENGKDSSLSYGSTTITANGGGYGGWASGWSFPNNQAGSGGCGGGAGTDTTIVGTGTQGQNGGSSSLLSGGGGGGGMTLVGVNGTSTKGGNGGDGIQCSQTGINLIYPSTYWGGGGGGGIVGLKTGGNGGLGGGGGGASGDTTFSGTQGVGGSGLNSGEIGTKTKGGNGGANTGGGGGGGPQLNSGGNGGSGIVVIAYLTP
jgi:hypothetical protein